MVTQSERASGKGALPKNRRKLGQGIFLLEQRVMFDAAAAATVADTHSDSGHTDAPPPPAADAASHTPSTDASATGGPAATAHEIVIIDGNVPNTQALIAGLQPGTIAFVLDTGRDGVQQIADIISANNLHDLPAIQIIAHGGVGEIGLGSTVLSSANLDSHAEALATIGAALAPGGDFLIYGCDVAADATGAQFVHEMSLRMGGVDIAASNDPTGAATLGGDWTLEVAAGAIEASLPFAGGALDSYSHLLTNETFTANQTITLAGDADGDGVIDPGETVTVTVTLTNNSNNTDASGVEYIQDLVGMTLVNQTGNDINVSPLAFNDSYVAIGNTLLEVGNATGQTGPQSNVAGSLFANDIEFFSDTFTLDSFTSSSANGGTVIVLADGSFTYISAANFTGTDTFTYTIRDKGLDGVAGNGDDLTGVGTVTITVSNQVWYVDSSFAGTSDGRSTNPFKTLADVTGASGPDDAGDIIYLAAASGNYGGGITLLNNQTLWGANEALVVSGINLKAAGADPTIVNAGGSGVTLAQGNTLKGFTVGDTTEADITDGGGTVGALTISNVNLTGTGQAVDIDQGGALNVTIDSLTSTNGANGVQLAATGNTLTGTFMATNGAISGSSGAAFLVGDGAGAANTGGAAAITYGGTITSGSGRAVDIQDRVAGAGTITFSGNITHNVGGQTGIFMDTIVAGTTNFTGQSIQISSTTADAVNIERINTGIATNFQMAGGGNGLDITTTTGRGMVMGQNGQGSGQITVTGSGNTISTTDGRILHWAQGTIGAAGVTFATLQKNGATSSNAIEIFNVDGPGAFNGGALTVTGASHGFYISGNSNAAWNFDSATMTSVAVGIRLSNAGNGAVTFGTVDITANSGLTNPAILVGEGSNGNLSINGGTITNAGNGRVVGITPVSGGTSISGGTINIAANLTKTNIGNIVNATAMTGGTVTLSGNLSATGGFANGIDIQNNTGGTINFTGQTQTLTTGANTAINLATNTGATINFNPAGGGAGLDIATTSGAGFVATGGGTISVTGSGNTIGTTTGQIINLDGVSIGASGVTFASMQSTGTVANTAILLNNVDGAGTFNGGAVTVAATSGGTSDGIRISGGSSAAFNFASATIGGTAADALNLNGANGSVTFTTVAINGTTGRGLFVSGNTAAVNINGGNIGNTDDPAGKAFQVTGGSADINVAANLFKTTAGEVAYITNRTGGTITVWGNLSATGSATTGIHYQNNSGGTATFSGTTKTINLGGNSFGIDYNGNGASSTLNFTNGGLAVTALAGRPLAIAGGGAFNVSGSGNTITSGSGETVWLYAANTVSGTINANLTGTGKLIAIQQHTAGALEFSGNLTNTGAGSTGISISSSTGGSITFSGTSKAVTTTNIAAVDLTNNTGGTINFTNGGLVLNSTSATGFNATGGGTVTVQGSGNTITSTTGTALNVVDTTIGANDLTFQRISKNGGTNGIVLNNTGSSGGLTVTGDGTTSDNGSGGTIQNTTGVGILLTNTRDVSLDQMNITGSGDDGIRGQGVTNFSLSRSNLTNNGNATAENGIQFGEASGSVAGLLGTASITDTDVTGSAGNNVHIRNTSGTLDSFIVTNSSFNDLNDTTGANSFLFEASGTAIVTEAFITGSTFANNSPQRALEVQSHDTATISDFVVSGNTFNANGIHASFTQDTSSNLEFYFVNNNVTTPNTADNVLQAVNVFSSSQSTGGTIVGTISGNTINTNQENISGIEVVIQGRTDATLLIHDNDITGAGPFGNRGISVAFRGPTANLGQVTHDVTITNNTVDNVTGQSGLGSTFFPLAAINVEADNQSGSFASAPIVRADIRGNIVPSSSAFDLTSGNIQFYEYDGDGTPGEFQDGIGQLVNTTGAANATVQLSNTNTGSVAAVGIDLIAGPINTPPPVPTPLQAAPGGVEGSPADQPGDNTVAAKPSPDLGLPVVDPPPPVETPADPPPPEQTASGGDAIDPADPPDAEQETTTAPSTADERTPVVSAEPTTTTPEQTASTAEPPLAEDETAGELPSVFADDGVFSQAELDFLVDAAIQRWAAAGLAAEQTAALRRMNFSVTDMPGWYLGSFSTGSITIDADAAGRGWFLDETPFDDSEFGNILSATRLQTDSSGAPAGHFDLLTMLTHEMGHALGLQDSYSLGDRSDLMYGYLVVGERRLAADGQADGAIMGSIASEEFLGAPVSIGTLAFGKTVTVQFQTTIDAQSNGLIVNPVNQGTVTATNVVGFVDTNTNTVTTTLDSLTLGGSIFNDVDVSSTISPGDAGIQNVALSLFVDANNDNVADSGIALATTTTNGFGDYSFTGLAPGNYLVRVDSGNFLAGGALETYENASPVAAADPDGNVDNDNDAQLTSGGVVFTKSITLAYNTEPTAGTGNDTNNTLDVGFVQNQPPIVTPFGPAAGYTEQAAPVVIDSRITVADGDDANLTGATVTISSGFVTGDVLAATVGSTGITAVWDSNTHILTLSGTATKLQYQTVLRTVTFANPTNDDPTATARVASFVVNDGAANSNAGTVTINVTPVNDAPVATITPTGTDSAIVPIGDEILVNTATAGDQQNAQITTLANGGYVVVWENSVAAGEGTDVDVKAQVYNADGTTVGSEILVNTTTADSQYDPQITALSNGGFVVSWSQLGVDGFNQTVQEINAQMFNADGTAAGGEILVNTTTSGSQVDSEITALTAGGFVVTWTDFSGVGGDASGAAVKAQVFDDAGAAVGGEILVNTATAGAQNNSRVTALSGGSFVVTWEDFSQGVGGATGDTSAFAVKAQVFNADGTIVGSEILVNTATIQSQYAPQTTSLSNGGFVVTWQDFSQGVGGATGDTGGWAVKAQVFNADGTTAGSEILVNTATTADQYAPQITALTNGDFVVTWQDYGVVGGPDGYAVKAQVFNDDGTTVGTEITVNTVVEGDQIAPQIAALSDGGFVVTWQDYSNGDIKAQTFAAVGTAEGAEILVNGASEGDQLNQVITGLTNGGFAVAWNDGSQGVGGATGDTDGLAVKSQVYGPGYVATEQVDLDLHGTGLSVSDIDNNGGVETVTLSVGEGIITIAAGNSGVTIDSGSGTSSVTFSGTIAQLNALLDGSSTGTVVYNDNTDAPSASTTLTLTVDDNGNTGSGGDLVAATTATIAITAVNDAPALTGVGPANASSTEQVLAVLDGTVAVSDADLDALNGGAGDYAGASAYVTRDGGASNDDTFGIDTTGASFTIANGSLQIAGLTFAEFSGSGGSGVISFTSQDTPATTALVNEVIRRLTYANQSDNPPASVDLVYAFSDGNETAQGTGGELTTTELLTVDIAPVNDAPVANIGGEILVNTATAGGQFDQQVTTLANGGYVVTWLDFSQGIGGATGDTDNTAVKAQVFTADGTAVGGEILVNTAIAGGQSAPQITALPNGGFVVAWYDESQGSGGATGDTDNGAIKAQVFNADGTTVGNEILVNTATANAQDNPKITALSDGGFVVTWTDYSGGADGATGDTDGSAIKAQVFAADGTAVGGEILVNTVTLNDQDGQQVTALSNGGFVVTWEDYSLTPSGGNTDLSVRAQVFAADGAAVGGEILVNTATDGSQAVPEITALSNGGFVVTWRDDSEGAGGATGDTSSNAVKAQVFAADGTPVGGEILVNTATADEQGNFQIAALSNGGFVVTWTDSSHGAGGAIGDADGEAIKAQVFTAGGTAVGGEILVNTATAGDQIQPQVAALADGGFVVTWENYSGTTADSDGSAAIMAQEFNADGTTVGGEILVNTATASDQYGPRIAALANGSFVVTWQDESQGVGGATGDYDSTAIKAQVFGQNYTATEQVDLNLHGTGLSVSDVDGNGGVETVTLSVGEGIVTIAAGTSGIAIDSGNGTSSVTFSGTLAQLNALLNGSSTGTVVYNANTDTPSASTTLTLTVDDNGNTGSGGNLTGSTTATINIAPVNDAPILTTTALDPAFTEAAGFGTQAAAVAVFSGTSVGTVEAGQSITSLTFTVVGLLDGSNENVVIDGTAIGLVDGTTGTTTGGKSLDYSISVTGNTATVTLTHAGLSVASANAAIDGIAYQNTSTDNPSDGNRVFTLTQVKDNGGGTAPNVDTRTLNIASTVNVNLTNDAPTVDAPATLQGIPGVALAITGITFADIDGNAGTQIATFTAPTGSFAATDSGGVTVTGSGTGTLSLTGTLADLNAFIAASELTFTDTANTAVHVDLNDQGNTGAPGALAGTDDISIVIDQPPVLSSAGNTVGYTEQGAPVVLNSGITLTDPDAPGAGNQINSATVTITGGFFAGDVLSADTGATGIVATYNSGTQTLTLTGGASMADYQSVLQQVTFASTSENPANDGGNLTRTITWEIRDNYDVASTTVTTTVNVTSVNDAPVNTVPGAQSVNEDSNLVLTGATAIQIADVDGGTADQTVTLSVLNGTLTFGGSAVGLTSSANGAATITLTGSIAEINTALSSLTYAPNADYNGPDTLTVTTNDLGNTGIDPGVTGNGTSEQDVDTVAITVNSVNDAPSGADDTITILEDQTHTFATADFGFTDAADDNSLLAVRITSLPTAGTLTLDGGAVSTGDFISAADIADGKLLFAPVADANGAGYSSFTFQVQDNGTTANGGADLDQTANTITFDITPVNDVPSFTVGGDQTVPEDSGAQTVNGFITGISTGPADEAGQAVDFLVSNDNNALFSVQPTIDAAGNLTYTLAANANGSAVVSVQIHDNGGGADTSAAQTFNIDVTPVNDVPSFTVGGDQTVLEDSSAQTVNGFVTGVSTGPADEAGQAVDFIVANDNNALFSVQPTIDASGNLTYTLAANANGSAVVSVQIRDNGGGTDTSAVQTFTIGVTPVNDAAVIAGDTTGVVTEAGGVANGTPNTPTATGTLTDTDIDNPANTFQAVAAGATTTNGYGTFAMTAAGTWTFTLDNSNAAVQALNTGGTLTDAFTVATVDGTTQVVTVTINGANDNAVISGAVTGGVTEAGGIANGTAGTPTATGTLASADIDNAADTFQSVAAGTASNNGYGTYAITAGGAWTYLLDDSNAAVQALRPGDTLTDTFTVSSIDGTTRQITITIAGSNDTPVVVTTTNIVYNADLGQEIIIDAPIGLTDIDSANIVGATVTISSGLDGLDRLGFQDQNGITGVYDAGTGTLTLTGNASVVAYQAALASITFQSSAQDSGDRTVSWQVDDGAASDNLSPVATTSIQVEREFVTTVPQTSPSLPTPPPPTGNLPFTSLTVSPLGGDSVDPTIDVPPAIYLVQTEVTVPDLTASTGGGNLFAAQVSLADMLAPLSGGQVTQVFARQANGDPLPDWLIFDPRTGILAGNVPEGAAGTITVQVIMRDAGNRESVVTFTFDLATRKIISRQGWLPPRGMDFGFNGVPIDMPYRHAMMAGMGNVFDAQILDGEEFTSGSGTENAPLGRAGLSEQLRNVGWQGMHAKRLALLESVRQQAVARR